MADIVTTQRTAKKYKGALLVFGLALIVGLIGTCSSTRGAGASSSWALWVLLTVVGGVGFIVARFLAWWNHG